MIKLEDQFMKYQALAALAAAANYSNLMTSSFMFKRNEEFDEPSSKKFKADQTGYSDVDSDGEEDPKETNDEEIDVGSGEFFDEDKIEEKTPKKSSFFISDILGLDSPKSSVKNQHNIVEQFIQNYQHQLQRTFDICRLVSINSSSEKEEKKETTNDSASILSSLEKLAKSQLDETTHGKTTNFHSIKKSDKKDDIVKKWDDSAAESESQGDKKSQNQAIPNQFPAWVYCTRYSDRPSAGRAYQSQLSVFY